MIDAARLKRARRRSRALWIGAGLIGSTVFLGLASFIMWAVGVDKASFLFTVMMGAMVLAMGCYAVVFFASVMAHVLKRVWNRQPIMDREDY